MARRLYPRARPPSTPPVPSGIVASMRRLIRNAPRARSPPISLFLVSAMTGTTARPTLGALSRGAGGGSRVPPPQGAPSLCRLARFVRGGGCSGFQYQLAFDDRADGDVVLEDHWPCTLVDAQSLRTLMASTSTTSIAPSMPARATIPNASLAAAAPPPASSQPRRSCPSFASPARSPRFRPPPRRLR